MIRVNTADTVKHDFIAFVAGCQRQEGNQGARKAPTTQLILKQSLKWLSLPMRHAVESHFCFALALIDSIVVSKATFSPDWLVCENPSKRETNGRILIQISLYTTVGKLL